jgi:hypothetical protein
VGGLRKSALVLLLLPTTLVADEVFLKDAGTITGRIVEQTDSTVKVDVGGGIIGVPTERVERIVKGRCALDDYEDRARKLKPADLKGWKQLGKWASSEGLSAQSRDAFKKVLALDPNDPDANTAMGLVALDGKWVTQEESYKARGFVQYDGMWMTQAEAQLAQQREADESARRVAEDRAREAEAQAAEAQARAREAEAKQKQAEAERLWHDPLYWGGWGYGVSTWPAAGTGQAKIIPKSQIPVKVFP